eukprot:Tbor_TRINITY_DN3327_c0_g1::TRINITY_DN3327_c0_g1_i2::g.23511::m.23511
MQRECESLRSDLRTVRAEAASANAALVELRNREGELSDALAATNERDEELRSTKELAKQLRRKLQAAEDQINLANSESDERVTVALRRALDEAKAQYVRMQELQISHAEELRAIDSRD